MYMYVLVNAHNVSELDTVYSVLLYVYHPSSSKRSTLRLLYLSLKSCPKCERSSSLRKTP